MNTNQRNAIARSIDDLIEAGPRVTIKDDGTVYGGDNLYGTWTLDGEIVTFVQNGRWYAGNGGTSTTTYRGTIGRWLVMVSRDLLNQDGTTYEAWTRTPYAA